MTNARPLTPEEQYQRELERLGRPTTASPRKRRDCVTHEFLLRDVCHWCGAPMPGVDLRKEAAPG